MGCLLGFAYWVGGWVGGWLGGWVVGEWQLLSIRCYCINERSSEPVNLAALSMTMRDACARLKLVLLCFILMCFPCPHLSTLTRLARIALHLGLRAHRFWSKPLGPQYSDPQEQLRKYSRETFEP